MIRRALRQIGHIARKEVRELLRSGQLRWGAALVLLLLGVSLLLGVQAVQRAEEHRAEAAETARALWESQPGKNPHVAAHYGIHVFKPRGQLSFVDEGILQYVGVSVHLGAHVQKRFVGSAAADATSAQRFGNLTPASVLSLLFPLLIILVVYPIVAGERDRGTLLLVMSLGIRSPTLVTGKAVGGLLGLGILLIPVLVLGAAVMVLGAGDATLLDARTVLLVGSYLLYFGLWLTLALGVSLGAPSGRSALVTLLGFWIVTGVVAPRLAGDVGKHLLRTGAPHEIQERIAYDQREGLTGDSGVELRVAALERRVLAEYGVDRLEELPVNFAGIRLQALEDYGNAVIDKHYGQLWDTFERQRSVYQAAALVAPYLAIRSLSQGLAGTDLMHHRHFADAAETYRRHLVRRLHQDLIYNAPPGVYAEYQTPPEVWESMPPFQYTPPTTMQVLRYHALDVVTLVLWTVGSLVAVWLGARRLSPVA